MDATILLCPFHQPHQQIYYAGKSISAQQRHVARAAKDVRSEVFRRSLLTMLHLDPMLYTMELHTSGDCEQPITGNVISRKTFETQFDVHITPNQIQPMQPRINAGSISSTTAANTSPLSQIAHATMASVIACNSDVNEEVAPTPDAMQLDVPRGERSVLSSSIPRTGVYHTSMDRATRPNLRSNRNEISDPADSFNSQHSYGQSIAKQVRFSPTSHKSKLRKRNRTDIDVDKENVVSDNNENSLEEEYEGRRDEARTSDESNRMRSQDNELLILSCLCYQPNRKINFYMRSLPLPEFNFAWHNLEQAKSALLKSLHFSPAHHYVELHALDDCERVLNANVIPPDYYKRGQTRVHAHVVQRQRQIASEPENALQSTTNATSKVPEPRVTDITNFIMTRTDETGAEVHYIRVGEQKYKRKSNTELEYMCIVVARVKLATESIEPGAKRTSEVSGTVNFILTDASVLTKAQYGHCDLGIPFDFLSEEYTQDSYFQKLPEGPKGRSMAKQILLDVAYGKHLVCDTNRQGFELFQIGKSKPVKKEDDWLEHTLPLCTLPLKPEYQRQGRPPVLGDVNSSGRIRSVIYWRNETRTRMELDGLMNTQASLEPGENYKEFEKWILEGDNLFNGLEKFLCGKKPAIGKHGMDWSVEIFVMAQIPESVTMWSWTNSANEWTAGQWLSGRASEAFDRSLYMEVHIKPIVKETMAKMEEAEKAEEVEKAEVEEEEEFKKGRSATSARQPTRRSARKSEKD